MVLKRRSKYLLTSKSNMLYLSWVCYLWNGQNQDIPLGDQMGSDQSSSQPVPDLDLSCRIAADDGVVIQKGDAPDHHLPALWGSNASVHQQPVSGVACNQNQTRGNNGPRTKKLSRLSVWIVSGWSHLFPSQRSGSCPSFLLLSEHQTDARTAIWSDLKD